MLGQDMVCLPVLERPECNTLLGYRYFAPEELGPGLKVRTRFLAAILDGPFQRLVNRHGLMQVLLSWAGDREATATAYHKESMIAIDLIARCLETGFDAIIMADDMAGGNAPLMHPKEFHFLGTPFYSQAVPTIKEAGVMAFLHSCGNLTRLVPLIKSWNFDGLAAIQICNNDLALLDQELGGFFLAGIEASLFDDDPPAAEELEITRRFLVRFAGENRLVLSSGCGLYKAEFWGRYQRVCALLDGINS
jgi:uroporphyrinogen decarboxylase